MPLFRFFNRCNIRPIKTPSARLHLQSLEAREVPAVDLLAIADSDFTPDKALFVPVTAVTSDGNVTYTVQSSNSGVTASVLTGGRTVKLTVTGKDSNNQEFTGTLTIRLFEDVAPLATNNIVTLVKTGYYDGKEFHRVVNDFVIQGGSPNGDGQGGSNTVSDVRDEYNPKVTFASRGIVAMANAGDDNNNAQFFITDPFILSNGSEVPAPLDRRSQFLNFNHTIVGILTSGFDTYQKIMDVPKVLGNDGAVSQPVNDVIITDAEILDVDTKNAVLRIDAGSGFSGSSTITVTGTEPAGDNSFQSKAFTVTAVADTVNDRPFLGAIGNITTAKNTAANFTLPFSELDTGDTRTFAVGRVVNTANGPVFTTLDPSQATATVDSNGKVTVTPATDFVGSFTLTVGIRDAQDRIGSTLALNDARNFDTEKISVTVGSTSPPPPPAANTAPTIANIANQSTNTGVAAGPIGFIVGDAETPVANLTLTVTSSNLTLVPVANVLFGGSGANRTITVTPVAGQNGTATLTVTLRDADATNPLTATDSFDLVVTSPPPTVPPTVTLIAAKDTIGVGRDILFTANVANATDGVVQFLEGTTVLGNIPLVENKALLSTNFSVAEEHTVTAKFIPNDGDDAASGPLTITVTDGTPPVAITAEGQAAGTNTKVVIKNASTNATLFTVDPYPGFTGLIRVKVADVTGDGQQDVIAVPGFGGGPLITVFDGLNGNLVFQRMIFEDHFRGGLSLDVGDAKGLGYAQILVGAGLTGGPRVTLLDAVQNKVLLNYFAYDNANRGGVSVAMSDLRGGNVLNIVTGAGDGLSPNVNVYNPFSVVGFEQPALYGTFIAGSATDKTGIRVGASDYVTEDANRRDVLVGDFDKADINPLDQAFNPVALGVFVD